MAGRSLLQQIHDDYVAQHSPLNADPAALLKDFCEYAAKWLSTSGIIGMGYSANGMALRLASGAEIDFFQPPIPETLNTTAVNITGNAAGVNPTSGTRPLDVSITGS